MSWSVGCARLPARADGWRDLPVPRPTGELQVPGEPTSGPSLLRTDKCKGMFTPVLEQERQKHHLTLILKYSAELPTGVLAPERKTENPGSYQSPRHRDCCLRLLFALGKPQPSARSAFQITGDGSTADRELSPPPSWVCHCFELRPRQ